MTNWRNSVEQNIRKTNSNTIQLDLTKQSIRYTDAVKKPVIEAVRGDEEIVRAFLVHRLVDVMGYAAEKIELEKQYISGRKNTAAKRIDVIVYDQNDNPFFFVEVKAPDKFDADKDEIKTQLFALARQETKKVKYLVYYTLNNEADKAIIIDFEKYNTYEKWEDANFPSCGSEITAEYGAPRSQPFVCGVYDLSADFTKEFVEKLTTRLHNLLWRGTSSNEIFNSLVNIILAKIQDEYDKVQGDEYQFQIFQYDGQDEDETKIFQRINALYHRALEEQLFLTPTPQTKKSDVVNLDKFPMQKLILTIRELQGLSLLGGRNQFDGKDILGDFFEEITRTGFFQDKGQFFTPIPIVRFMLYALQIDELSVQLYNEKHRLPYIIDPSCGSGTFMVEAMKMIKMELTDKRVDELETKSQRGKEKWGRFFPDHAPNQWAKDFIYASDFDFELGTAAKVNMILHGDGSAHFHIKDGLAEFSQYEGELNKSVIEHDIYPERPQNKQFDIILSNPPFSVKIDEKTQKGLRNRFLFADKKNSENLFIERYYQLLREGGRLGVVLPESIFDTTENKYIRLFLFKYFHIKAVVSVPQVTFEPYTSTKTSLLFAQKKTNAEVKAWNETWHQYGKEWARLKTRVTRYYDFFVSEKPLNKQWAWVKELGSDQFKLLAEAEDKIAIDFISEKDETKIKENIYRFLKNYINEKDKALTIKDLLLKYSDEIAQNRYDNDTKEIFGYYNNTWVFSETAKKFPAPVFMAEVESVGYKRTKRGVRDLPNDLFDLEIAPTWLDVQGIREKWQQNIQDYEKALQKDLDIQTELEIKQQNNYLKSNEKDLAIRENSILRYQEHLEQLNEELNTFNAFVEKYYIPEKGKTRYRLQPEYHDRLDKELLDMFRKDGLLEQYDNASVLLRKNEIVNVLDMIRKEVQWA